MKKDLTKIFYDEICSKPPMRIFSTNKIIYDHIDERWSIDLADIIDYKVSNNKRFRYIFVIIDDFSKYNWCKPMKNKNSKTITDEFLNVLSQSKRKPLEIESDRGGEYYISVFQNFLKSKNIHH